MKNGREIIIKVREYIEELLKENLKPEFLYHNINHTLEVYNNCSDIADGLELTGKEKEILLLAALFHDTGFVNKYDGHEEEGAKIAEDLLGNEKYPQENISEIKKLILSTKKEVKPSDKLEEIMHDADIAHIGKKGFFRKGDFLRLELEKIKNKSYSDMDWAKMQLDFLSSNKFYTVYAAEKFETRHAKNINRQRKIIANIKKEEVNVSTGKYIGRGIDTLYRTTFRNHINLSEIADGKANMMISINTIILSVIITLAASGLTLSQQFFIENFRFTFPVFTLMIGSLASVIFAILSAKPNVTKGKINIEDLEKSKKSILFFGNFVMLEMEKFIEGIKKLKHDQSILYDSMSVDLYYLGKVLSKKYRLLSYSYIIFMSGLVVSVLSFILIFFFTFA